MDGIRRRGLTTLAVLAGALAFAPSANAAVSSVFTGMPSPAVSCDVQSGGATDGQRWCTGTSTRVQSWDHTPIDVSVFLPPVPTSGPDGNYPLIGIYHGWGGSKAAGGAAQRWVTQGYAVFSMTDRGWRNSCGSAASRTGLPGWADCDDGNIKLIDYRYEARDAQFLIGHLVDEGLVDPDRIGAFGGSYGGLLSSTLGALNSRTVLPDGSYVPWTSPNGTPLHIAAAAPNTVGTDILYTQQPNGSTLDYVSDSSYFGPDGTARVGVQKAGVMNGFFYGAQGSGVATLGPEAIALQSAANGPGPYDSLKPALQAALTTHGAFNVDDSVAPAPMILGAGWSDDFVPVSEPLKYYNKIRADHPGTPVAVFAGDFGHARASDKDSFEDLRTAWMNYYVRDERTGAKPPENVVVSELTCPTSAPSGQQVTLGQWSDAANGEVRLRTTDPQTIQPSGATDGETFFGSATTACATAPAADNPTSANYRTDAASGDGYDVLGGAMVFMRLDVSGQSDQIAARLLDVGPDGQETLIERALLRPDVEVPDEVQHLQLNPDFWHVAAGHQLKLELLADDGPYSHVNAADAGDPASQHAIVVRDLELRVPTMQGAGTAGVVQAQKPLYLPPGYVAAPGFESKTTTKAPDFDAPKAKVKKLKAKKLKPGKKGRRKGAKVKITLGGTDAGDSGIAAYMCKLDKGKWRKCKSPVRYRKVKKGRHTFRVYAIDGDGNEQAKPTVEKFKVEVKKAKKAKKQR